MCVSIAGAAGGQSTGVFLAGLSVSREFSLDPYFIRTPLPRLSGAATGPSTLDVYVNGALVRSEAIAPGTFELKNLPVTEGERVVGMLSMRDLIKVGAAQARKVER